MVVHELASARHAPLVAAGSINGAVAIWNEEACQKLTEIDTIFGFGGRRLVLSSDGTLCIAADYTKQGLACYDSLDGRQVWVRPDLKKISEICITRDGAAIYCGVDDRGSQKVDLRSGRSLLSLKGENSVLESPYMPIGFYQERVPCLQSDDGRQLAQISAITDSGIFLSAAFSPKEFCISEMGGPVRSLSVESGAEAWRYTPSGGSHVLLVEFSESNARFFGVEWTYIEGGPMKLLRFGEDGESVIMRDDIRAGAHAFCSYNNCLITSDGEVIDLKHGRTVRRLSFW